MTAVNNKTKIVGTLVPISALRSNQQSEKDWGTFETGLYFLDWLHKTNQSAWQLLPLHETQLEKDSATIHVPSPYKGYGIGLDPEYLSQKSKIKNQKSKEIDIFIRQNKDWIEDYAFFCALRDHFGTDNWVLWESGLRKRDQAALTKWRIKLEKEINNHIFTQWQLHESYKELRAKAHKFGIALMGDLPFYLSVNSPLVWAHQELFQIPKSGKLRFVSGCPDTPAAHFGRQVWGHPLYNWDSEHRSDLISFWKLRLGYLSKLYDSVRFDHAKALFEYGKIDLKNKYQDKYVKGPGQSVFEELMIFGKKSGLSMYAEDSGENLKMLRIYLKKFKTPGIKIFRFALNEKKKKLNKEYALLSNYPQNTVAYTTTHDTEPLLGYLNRLTVSEKKLLSLTTGVKYSRDDKEFAQAIIKAVIASPAHIVIVQLQDWILTTDRINIPGTEKEVGDLNWRYKLKIPIEELPDSI
ncbi:MAG TPA: 4-alpha-glucanotransferase [Candidatus Saccharimonadales bacterium]|nr:4-alpha-glucanotransferase [Candidatus Saccharimonadales bacterium]